MSELKISRLFVYPLKSARGIALDSMTLNERGPEYDRQWMVVKESGKFQTQRQLPEMCLIETGLNNGQLELNAPGMPLLTVNSGPGEVIEVEVWGDRVSARDCGDEAATWLSHYLGRNLRLVEMPAEARRLVDTDFAKDSETVGFADGFPILLVSEASLQDFNRHLDAPIDMDRFRPNIVLEGCEPFAEDSWHELEAGGLRLSIVKPCSRCIIPSIDQRSATKQMQVNEALLAHRRRDGKTFFGQNVLHRNPGELKIGDAVSVVQND